MAAPSVSAPTNLAAASMVFTPGEKWRVALIFVGIITATLLGLAATFLVGQVYGIFIGLGILCYTLGLRHGVDADHICAIDNTTRKLLQQGKRPYTVGTWFSLGHSTIVMAMLVALVIAERWVVAAIPAFRTEGTIIGTAVSGGFLYLIAFINLLIFLEIYAIFRKLRSGTMDQQELEEQLNKRGFMNRYFNFLFKLVNEPWQIYPIGVLFGLGFDTASEVALITTTLLVATLSTGFPLWTVLILPFMFTCGMVLTDTVGRDRHALRVRLGLPETDPESLLQPHHDRDLGPGRLRRGDDRDPRGHRRPVPALRRPGRGVDPLELAQRGRRAGLASTSGATSGSPSWPSSSAAGWSRWRSTDTSATRRLGSVRPLRPPPRQSRAAPLTGSET